MNQKSTSRTSIIAKLQFGKSTTISIQLRDGTIVTVDTRLEHMDTEVEFKITYPDGTEDKVSSREL